MVGVSGSAASRSLVCVASTLRLLALATAVDSDITITVRDDGPGFSQDIIDRLGDPFVTSRKGYGPGDPGDGAGRHEGMGLGFFIAKTLCEHTGATVTYGNRESGGACVKLLWRREQMDISYSD